MWFCRTVALNLDETVTEGEAGETVLPGPDRWSCAGVFAVVGVRPVQSIVVAAPVGGDIYVGCWPP